MRVTNDDPPLFTLLLWIVLRKDWLVEDLESFSIRFIFILVSSQSDEKFDGLIQAVSTYRVRLASSLSLVLDLQQRVAIADIGQLGHLVIRDRNEFLANFVLHVHEVANLLNLRFSFELVHEFSIETRQLHERTLLRPHGLYDHLRKFHSQESCVEVAICADHIDHCMDQLHRFLQNNALIKSQIHI